MLLHGFTNCPQQFVPLAEQLNARGHNVVIPRLSGHGYADRSARHLAPIRAERWLAETHEALDLASGLGERVALSGISLGGSLAARVAAARADVARAVCVAPLFGLLHLPPIVDVALCAVLTRLPDVEIPWDPFGNQEQIPDHAYAKYSTRALGQCLRIGDDIFGSARKGAPCTARSVAFFLNAHDPAVNNEFARRIAGEWNLRRAGSAQVVELGDLPAIHDIIEPGNPYQRVAEIYPKLIELLES